MLHTTKFSELENYFRKLKWFNIKEKYLSFNEIEKIIGSSLCDSAYNYEAYWANDGSHTIGYSWLNTGYHSSKVNVRERAILFIKNN